VPGCEINDVTVAGARRLRARCWDGSGRPLVVLHGLLDSSEGWKALAEATHRPLIAFDLPGFGGSALPLKPRIDSYADAIADGLGQLAIDECTLVGHSLGGAIAAAVSERSDAVRSLVLLAPAGFGEIRLADAFALPGVNAVAMRALPLALMSPPLVAAAYATLVSRGQLPSPELLGRLRSAAWAVGPGTRAAVLALSHCGHARDAFHRRRLAFDGPVAALWGEHDALVPAAHAAGVRHALPQARVEIWHGMGHHSQRERPAELAHFVEQHASRARRCRRLPAIALPVPHAA
jgi:pimeloyl-ACP methyl ester carboxylesterase